jgi:hypothetical protein
VLEHWLIIGQQLKGFMPINQQIVAIFTRAGDWDHSMRPTAELS